MLYEHFKKAFIGQNENFSDIVGQEDAKKQLKSAILTDRHVIIVGAPGIGKTTLARNLSRLLPSGRFVDCAYNCLPESPVCPECLSRQQSQKPKLKEVKGEKRFVRVQGSPDLTAEDLIGDIDPIKAMKFGPLSIQAFTPGKIFKANNGVLFFDEINRCPEKLQNALLQVLEERKVTIGSYDVEIKADFIFIGTMNPMDSSTEKLSDVFLDRFDLVYMNYPENPEAEKSIVKSKGAKLIDFPEELFEVVVYFIRSLRQDERLEKLPSVRASIGLYERAQANAMLKGSRSVELSDIKESVVSVLSHRIKLKPSSRYLMDAKEFTKSEFEKVMDSRFSGINEKGGSP